jgi:glc operon protein GlcG
MSVDVCIAVTDAAGHLLAMARMDRAPLLCIGIAQDKAYSVATFAGLPTKDWWGVLESDPALMRGIVKTDHLVVFGGGVPLVADGRTIGAIGVSGGTSDQMWRSRRRARPRSVPNRDDTPASRQLLPPS